MHRGGRPVCRFRVDDEYRAWPVGAGDGLRYEPGIDGLRAVAVGVVLAFHGGFSWMTGGFLGVSVFFTLSGFLITRLLIDEQLRTGRISLLAFWGRRLRRLAPASLVCLFAVVVLAPWWSDVLQREALRVDVWSALTYWPNWRFIAAEQSYSDLFAAPSPVLHFWSLAIEEQFYFLYPIIVAVAMRLGKARPRPALGGAVTMLLVGSSIAGRLTSDRDLLYYGTHIRAAELLVGAVAALVAPRLIRVARQALAASGAAAIIAIVVLCVTSSTASAWVYDGRLVLFAGLSAVAVMSATVVGPVRRVLSWRFLVAIGQVSYGLYLFHWPVFLLLDERRVGWGRWPLFGLRLIVTAVVTVASYRLIEQPVRRRYVLMSPRVARLAFAGAMGIVAVTAPLTRPSSGPTAVAADIPSGVVRFDEPSGPDLSSVAPPRPTLLPGQAPAPAPTSVAPTSVAPTSVIPTTVIPTTVTPTTVAAPAPKIVVGFAGSDVSIRARLMAVAEIDVRDLLPVGCPLTSYELAPGCPEPQASIPRMMAAVTPQLIVIGIGSAERAALDAVTGDDRLQLAGRLTRSIRRAAEAAVGNSQRVLIVDTSGLTDSITVGVDQVVLAQPSVQRLESPELLVEVRRALALAEPEPVHSPAAAPAATAPGPPGLGERLKILVIGDSTSYELAAALARGDGNHEVVWGGGANCPLVDVDRLRWSTGADWPMDECPNVTTVWPETIAELEPDVVLVVASLAEQSEHRYAGSEVWRVAGDPEFAAAHEAMMTQLLELVAPFGGVVLVADAPPIVAGSFVTSEMAAPDRLAGWNAQIAAWDARWQPVEVVGYSAAVAWAEFEGPQRDDGVHLTRLAADQVAAELTPVIVSQIARLRQELVASGCLDVRSGALRLRRCGGPSAPSGG